MFRCIFFLLLFLLFLPFGGSCAGYYHYDYNDNCRSAYRECLSLHFSEAEKYVAAEQKANPGNLMPVFLADYEDCILLLLNNSKEEYQQKAGHLNERIGLLDRGGDEASPWYGLCKAGIYLHWAIINIRFGDQYKAAINFHHSFALLNKNRQQFPQFEYNNVYSGLEEAVVGSLPGSYKWLASIFGMKGDVKRGTEKLAVFTKTHKTGNPLYDEAVLYSLYTRFYLLGQQQEVWNVVNGPEFGSQYNLLHTFVKANIGLDFRKADAAIEVLHAASTTQGFSSYPIFYYQYGAALLTKLDTSAVYWFRKYVQENKSDMYIKDCWQKMAFAWYVNGRPEQANYCLQQVKDRGSARIDADKQAARFAESHLWPPVKLLQARLLIEGGYYSNALDILQGIDKSALNNPADVAEYYFRFGRVYEELAVAEPGKQYYQHAFTQYRLSVTVGKSMHEQFAARSALQMGKMYEHLDLYTEAAGMYRECLDMPSHDFQNSIDQQAKAGINRVEGH